MIPKMIAAGTDIFRLNCSHRRGGDFERVYPLIRKTAAEMGKKVGEIATRGDGWWKDPVQPYDMMAIWGVKNIDL